MKITIEIEGKPEEFQEVFVPSEKQREVRNMTYDAYCEALRTVMWGSIDRHKFVRGKGNE